MTSQRIIILLLSAFFLISSCDGFLDRGTSDDRFESASGELVEEWNRLAYESTIPLDHPLYTVRGITMMHLAMHDAINAIDARYEPYAFAYKNEKAHPEAALSSAAYQVLRKTFPDYDSLYTGLYTQTLSQIPDGKAKKEGLELGADAAEAILSLRGGDIIHGNPISQVPESDEPGVYQTVPPLDFLYAEGWETLKPFALQSYDQFRNEAPPALDSEIYSADFNLVKSIGALESAERSADETETVAFWYEYSEIGWNRIARRTIDAGQQSLWDTARIYALLNVGLMDAYIAGWDGKSYFNFWRP
ncbi:MAG: hypothetical protein R3281_06685 [Balneolaceae bacterium]|nr:hypothetical protein [Balneolaceae bacterium]